VSIPADGTVVWMRTATRSARATVLCSTEGHVHLRFDDPSFNCDGCYGPPTSQPFRILRAAAFASALERIEKESSR
jgi:hypothetical protein